MDFVSAIRDRRERHVQRALATLDLYAASDIAMRRPLLQSAAKAIADPRVAECWLRTLASEPDQGLRLSLLQSLASLDFRQLPATPECLEQLLACVELPDAREWALQCLTRIAPHNPAIVAPLIAAYRKQRDANTANRLLGVLLQSRAHSPELNAFLISVLGDIDATYKSAVVRQLLEQDALGPDALEKLLAPTEPSEIKILVLDHLVDRSIRMDDAAARLLRNDRDAACRYSAAWALAESSSLSPAAIDALLAAAGTDPDDRVRHFAIVIFELALAKTPAVITSFLETLRRETSLPRAALIVKLLAPHIHRNKEVIPALMSLLGSNLQTEIALEIYALLGTVAPWNREVMQWLIDACTREKEDRVKAAILRPLSRMNASDPQLVALYKDAMALPEPDIQQWGAQGVLLLPATPENAALLLDAAPLLLSPDIPLWLRNALARKMAMQPDKSPALLEVLKKTSDQSRDSELKKVCESAINEIVNDSVEPTAIKVDWAGWIHRSEVEHRADGIFPAIYEHFDESPDSGRRVLKALLNPQCSNSLYQSYGYDVSEYSILDFLDRKNAIDDDVSRFCIGRVLNQSAGSPDGYLQFLISNPGFTGLKDNVFKIIELRQNAATPLLRQLLVVAHGSDEAAEAALRARLGQLRGPEALAPYVRIVTENCAWSPAHELLKLLKSRSDLKADAKENVTQALAKFGSEESSSPSAPEEPSGPGFADE